MGKGGGGVASIGDTDRWQFEEPAPFEFVDHASGGKGFKLSAMGPPFPVTANMPDYFMSAPVRVLLNQIA